MSKMLTSTYSSLLNPDRLPLYNSNAAAEQKNSYHILTERHMQAMWLEQKYFKPLKNQKDELVEIISPGIWNSEAGPDFLKAHIRIGGREIRGDIELHLSQEGWYHHNHHTDANYNDVILHVCYWQPKQERTAFTSAGNALMPVYMQPALTISEGRILTLIDLDLYPYKHYAGSGNCSKGLFNNLPNHKTIALLRSAAAWRLKEKNERLKAKIEGPANYLKGGIAMALGFKHNAEAFLEIFNALATRNIKEELAIFIDALGMAHFFGANFQKKWGDSSFYRSLLEDYLSCEKETCTKTSNLKIIKRAPLIQLRLDKIRPSNHPVRRLAILAKIMCDPEIHLLETKLINLWNSSWKMHEGKNWTKLRDCYLELLPSYEDSYWNSHYTFEKKSSEQRSVALLGKDIKREILINVCFPLLYSFIEDQDNEEEKSAFLNFYGSIPASKTKKSVYLNYRFFGDKQQKMKICSADLQQGAYQIHRDFCVHFEASCQGCPFVERYKNAFG